MNIYIHTYIYTLALQKASGLPMNMLTRSFSSGPMVVDVPQMGDSITEGTILEWVKQPVRTLKDTVFFSLSLSLHAFMTNSYRVNGILYNNAIMVNILPMELTIINPPPQLHGCIGRLC
jgi:hypothetical protein